MTERLIYFGDAFSNEEKVLKFLDENLPPEYKILANLRISDPSLGEVEYDAIILGKYAVYVLEIKNFGGLIKGDAKNWEMLDKNNKNQSRKNPFLQLGRQVSILVSRLKDAQSKVLVQGFVCLSSEREPVFEVQDSEAHRNSVFWYKNSIRFLTDINAITLPTDWKRKNILARHDGLLELIQTGFSPRKIDNIPGYTIESEAWIGRRYKAYFAKREKAYPPRVLLKIYNVPESVSSPDEIKKFVDELNSRDFYALKKIEKTGDQNTGGKNYVLAGEGAFVHPSRDKSYVVATEWVNGKPLSNYISSPKNFTFQIRCLIASQICRGMAFVHSANVIHRNLSLENMVWSSDENKIKIINFDFAKFVDDPFGTIEDQNVLSMVQQELQEREKYQAPELRQGRSEKGEQISFVYHHANITTDIYALGVALLEIFTGILPDEDAIPRHLNQISDRPNLHKFISLCCSDKPGERPVSLLDAALMFEELAGMDQESHEISSLPQGFRLGIYAIASRLNQSSMSVVYLAENVWTKQQVVIKIPQNPSREDARNELLRAMEILDEIPSEITARLLHTDTAFLDEHKMRKNWNSKSREIYYQVWEYIDGDDLKKFLDDRKPESEVRMGIVLRILKIAATLHEKGWIHQDIKPENFISARDGKIKIIDFGLTKRISQAERENSGGTPGCYLPPEIISGGKWSQAGDVWSLGCLALVVLFGEEVCKGSGPSIQWEEVERKISPQVARVLRKATDINLGNRYESAREFLTEFEDARLKSNDQGEGKVNMDYGNVISHLQKKRDEADAAGDLGAVDSINADIHALEKWLAGGQNGDCPVDLNIYGIKRSDAAPATPTNILETTPDARDEFETIDVETIAAEEVDYVQGNLREELDTIRKLLADKEWHLALARALQVEEHARGEVKETARDLRSQAQVQVNKEIEKLLARGDAARAKGNNEKAQEHYQAVLELDESNSHARYALQEIGGLVKDRVSKAQQDSLTAGLKDRRDIKRLGDAVYDSEALDGEGKLPAKMSALLKEAREFYDKTRREQGEETTAMRFGDVSGRAAAVKKIENWVATNVKTIFDATTNSDRPAFDVLKEAQKRLQEASEDTAQYEINFAEKFKVHRPRYVHQRLAKALEQPFYEQEKRKLEVKLAEVDQYIQALEKAEELQAQAMRETEPVRSLGILLQARQTFASVPGLQEQISQIRPVAIKVTQSRINDALKRADGFILSQEYFDARALTNEAENLVAQWPETQAAEEIARLGEEIKIARERIDATEEAWKEYTRQAAEIRQKVADSNQRAAGLALFKQVSEDERFKGFSELRGLTSEIDQFKGVGEQLNDANEARDKGDWSRVFEIADKVIKTGTAGKLAVRFEELHSDAVTELNILRAQGLLANDEIPEAKNVLNATLNRERSRDPERETALRNRMSTELDRIQEAFSGNKPMQDLYDRACDRLDLRDNIAFKAFTSPSFALRQSHVGADGKVGSPEMRALINRVRSASDEGDPSPQELTERVAELLLAELNRKGFNERLDALRLFRYVGGDKTQPPEDAWPPYNLSLQTAEARRAARLLSESLRVDFFQPLVQKHADYQGKESELSDEILYEMAKQAGALREAYLLETENERAVGRWVEVEWGKREAQQEERGKNWHGALNIWKRLDNHHPGIPTVKRGLRNALIWNTIARANHLARNDHKGEEAVALLRELQSEPDMGSAWELNLALVDIHEYLGEFDAAFGDLEQARRTVAALEDERREKILSRIEEKRVELESRQAVYICTESAKNKVSSGNFVEALRLLQNGIDNPKITDATSLRNLRDDIFNKASEEILRKAHDEYATASDDGRIQAVISLMDLQMLEEMIGQPMEKRRSKEELNRLRKDLAPVASKVVRDARDFEPAKMPLPKAIDTASTLASRLQAFGDVTGIFTAELAAESEKLVKSGRDIAATLENLQSLEKILKEAGNQSLWEAAIRTGDFSILKQYSERIGKLELDGMQEIHAFERRLAETEETYQYLVEVISLLRKKFSVEDDFVFVMNKILETKVQPPFRENNEAWQVVHARQYEEIRRLVDDRLRVPDIYGRNDLVGWEKVLEEAEEREKELEIWKNWDKECARLMDDAHNALKKIETHPADLPTRDKKKDWEKALETAKAAISTLAYPKEEAVTDLPDGQGGGYDGLVVGARNARGEPIPIRSKTAKDLEKEGKGRKDLADQWARQSQSQVEALQAILDLRGFPSLAEFNDATALKDWDRLEKLLTRAREAGITSEEERSKVETFAKVLDQMRNPPKKRFNLF